MAILYEINKRDEENTLNTFYKQSENYMCFLQINYLSGYDT